MKVSELSGTMLNYWAGRAAGFSEREICIELRPLDAKPHAVLYADGATRYGHPFCGNRGHGAVGWQPSTDWAQAGQIIEREAIGSHKGLSSTDGQPWEAWWEAWANNEGNPDHDICYVGATMLEAAMRCYVASKFGDEVNDELAHP